MALTVVASRSLSASNSSFTHQCIPTPAQDLKAVSMLRASRYARRSSRRRESAIVTMRTGMGCRTIEPPGGTIQRSWCEAMGRSAAWSLAEQTCHERALSRRPAPPAFSQLSGRAQDRVGVWRSCPIVEESAARRIGAHCTSEATGGAATWSRTRRRRTLCRR